MTVLYSASYEKYQLVRIPSTYSYRKMVFTYRNCILIVSYTTSKWVSLNTLIKALNITLREFQSRWSNYPSLEHLHLCQFPHRALFLNICTTFATFRSAVVVVLAIRKSLYGNGMLSFCSTSLGMRFTWYLSMWDPFQNRSPCCKYMRPTGTDSGRIITSSTYGALSSFFFTTAR